MGEKALTKVKTEDNAQRNQEEQKPLVQCFTAVRQNSQPQNPYEGIGEIEREANGDKLVRFEFELLVLEARLQFVFALGIQVCILIQEGVTAVDNQDDAAYDAGNQAYCVVLHDVGQSAQAKNDNEQVAKRDAHCLPKSCYETAGDSCLQ